MVKIPDSLLGLTAYNQFILWTTISKGEKKIKIPIDYRTGSMGDAHDSNLWGSAQTMLDSASALGDGYGVGFVFTKNDPFFFLDLDSCLNPDGASWSEIAMRVMGQLPGAAVEVSQSGRGLHIFGSYSQLPDHSCKNIQLDLELYTSGRFVALTGLNTIGSVSTDCTSQLNSVIDCYFKPKENAQLTEWTTEPCEGWYGIDDDDKLLKLMLRTKSAGATFSNRASFSDLWKKNEDALAKAFPDSDRTFDESSADAALAQHLAFWTGKNCERIRSFMLRSGLNREKWGREDYLPRTIKRAVAMQKTVAGEGKKPLETPHGRLGCDPNPKVLSGYQYLGASQQIEHFKGCTYVQDIHKVFTPSGALLKPDQFNAMFGGYVFALDDMGDKVTRKAWEAFTESQMVRWPKAECITFRPELEPGSLIEREGRVLVNTYVEVKTKRIKGDATPFLNHLEKVLPNKKDQTILLSYMSACVQHKGVKFQWTPLLQGVEGNGKTLFTFCVAEALGKRYTHLPKAKNIDADFNSWLMGRLFIGVEDVYVADLKKEVIETLKPMITGSDQEIQQKGVDQITVNICCNFMLNSNHKDAIRKTRNDRRFCVFYTAQQNAADLERDGMHGDYFPKLYHWLKHENGYAIVNELFHTYDIPVEYNPAKACHRAPETSSTNEAINASLGGVEQEIMEAIDEDRTGFARGWVSSMALDRLLQTMRATRMIPPNKRRDLLISLGYDWHPSLKNGRVNNAIAIDGGKPRLFIKDGHIHKNLKTVSEVVKAYEDAQGGVVTDNKTARAFNN